MNDRSEKNVIAQRLVGVPDGRSFNACSLCGTRFRSEADFDSHRHHELGPWHGAYVGPTPEESDHV